MVVIKINYENVSPVIKITYDETPIYVKTTYNNVYAKVVYGTPQGNIPTLLSYYGNFYDTTNQIALTSGGYPNPNQNNSAPMAMKFNTTDFSNGVSIVDNSKITIANSGIYNIQFSAQFYNTNGGNEKIWIWLRKNGVDVSNTTTYLPIGHTLNDEQTVAAWNFLVDADDEDYYELMWASSQWNKVEIYYEAAASNPTRPAVPSIILTVVQESV
jgi:hypothetical protein